MPEPSAGLAVPLVLQREGYVPLNRTTGTITLVQEDRFKLVDRSGLANLFILAHDAPLDGEQLSWLQRRQMQVEVSHAPAHDLIAAVAYDVVPSARRRAPARSRSSR